MRGDGEEKPGRRCDARQQQNAFGTMHRFEFGHHFDPDKLRDHIPNDLKSHHPYFEVNAGVDNFFVSGYAECFS